MPKECFLVTAYCDTDLKKKVLKDTLQKLKQYNKDIILFSHYPVEQDSNDLTDYTIFDYSNPIMDFKHRSTIHWCKYKNYKLNTLYLDYGYAAVQQWKRGLLYASKLNYDNVYILNYDLVINKNLIASAENDLLTYDNVILDYGRVKMNDGGKYDPALHMSWCALKLKPFINKIKEINYDDYAVNVGFGVTENYMYQKLKSDNSKIIPYNKWAKTVTTSIKMDTGFIKDYYTRDGYNWIIGEEKMWVNNKEIGTNKCLLFLFNIKTSLDIEIYIKNNLISKTKIDKLDDHLIYLPFLFSNVKKYIGEFEKNKFKFVDNGLKIIINNLEIPKELLKLTAISAIEVANDNI
tara:strand:+ start:1182 stop:2228 length:1047 start_codon:yes stop_codon:yes gene_type:complete